MLRRSLSLQQRLSTSGFAIAIFAITLFMAPSVQAASCKIPKSYYKNVACTANSGYFWRQKISARQLL